ncbi:thioesterase II family protein [Streptomyces albireticuli]|uniref:Thioesterase n=1 Tax=Streptomyces albireticuli TaxID=1940 RepID=A0A2A2DDF8_9ACTN|nr:alpha/beta fold hydrolase [Streptomyces albireticuli]MCD9145002.1 alpha/beta fold hydrolase [Streptomyces albireticuli]MCD9164428.1 alpha/beta fold hydrolase [Streptomyces albireticuli]MCD9194139.1 alpha/beta fold hydrolase [Streptomyces albireticuli]PAU49429.1 thioesterase [Streptomyces albireticuli]
MNTQETAKKSTWIQNLTPRTDPAVRLVCLPYAGASATAYSALAAALPQSVEALSVQYPGRPGNREEPLIADVGELADRIAGELAPWLGPPVAVFGHSFGSVVAFEVTRRLEAAGTGPLRLVVSGRRSPSDGLGAYTPGSDEEIVAELKELGGVPAKLFTRPKFLKPVLDVVKNDYRANSGYLADPEARVACPVSFLLADADPYVAGGGERGWRRHTTAGFRVVKFPGGHFFLNEQAAAVAEKIGETLGEDVN